MLLCSGVIVFTNQVVPAQSRVMQHFFSLLRLMGKKTLFCEAVYLGWRTCAGIPLAFGRITFRVAIVSVSKFTIISKFPLTGKEKYVKGTELISIITLYTC